MTRMRHRLPLCALVLGATALGSLAAGGAAANPAIVFDVATGRLAEVS